MNNNISLKNSRDSRIDFLRGVGIIMMLYGHAAKYTSFIALFHMALFFLASGYCYNEERVKTLMGLVSYIKRKFVTLWKPYFLFNAIFIILHNFFIKINVYTSNPSFLMECNNSITKVFTPLNIKDILKEIVNVALFQGDTQVGGALWFLQTLFFTTIAYGIIDYILFNLLGKHQKWNIYIQLLISVIFLLVGWYFSINGITAKHFNRVMSCYWLLYVGHIFKKFEFMQKLFELVKPIIIFVVMLIALILLRTVGFVSLNANTYVNPIFLIACSLCGWFMVYSLSYMLDGREKKWITYISMHSIPIVALHFLAFKVVNYIYVIIKGIPYFMVAAFPTVTLDIVWWVAYMIAGMGIPLLLDGIYRTVFKDNLLRQKKEDTVRRK